MTMNLVICGEATQILSTYKANCIDLVITDPPYLVRYRDQDGRTLAKTINQKPLTCPPKTEPV
jgi:DNA modification methylase